MLSINLVENCIMEKRDLATPKEIFEVILVMFFMAAAFSALILFILNGLVSIFTDLF